MVGKGGEICDDERVPSGGDEVVRYSTVQYGTHTLSASLSLSLPPNIKVG